MNATPCGYTVTMQNGRLYWSGTCLRWTPNRHSARVYDTEAQANSAMRQLSRTNGETLAVTPLYPR